MNTRQKLGHRVTLRPVIAGTAVLAAVILGLTACGSDSQDSATADTTTTTNPTTSSTTPTNAPAGQFDQQGVAILDAILAGDFTTATANFDADMQQVVPPDKLRSAWEEYQVTFGKYQSHGDPQQVPFGNLSVVNIPLQMEKEPGEFRVTFHPDGKVAGLWFLKVGVPIS